MGLRDLLDLRDDIECCREGNPLDCIRHHNRDVLVAVVEAQLQCLWEGPPADDAQAVAEDVLRYIEQLDAGVQRRVCGAPAR